MPALINQRHEAYARLRVQGFTAHAAARRAGFKSSGSGWWLNKQELISARIAELADHVLWGETPDLAPVINELMRLARQAGEINSAAGLVAARGLLAEAAKLKGRLDETAGWTRDPVPREPPLTTEAWLAKHAPPR